MTALRVSKGVYDLHPCVVVKCAGGECTVLLYTRRNLLIRFIGSN